MKIYKVSYTHSEGSQDPGSHSGYGYYSSKRKAEGAISKSSNTEAEITVIAFSATKKGILAVLNQHGSHADNG